MRSWRRRWVLAALAGCLAAVWLAARLPGCCRCWRCEGQDSGRQLCCAQAVEQQRWCSYRHAREAAQSHVTPTPAEAQLLHMSLSEQMGRLTKGLWLVWEYEGDKTLAYYLKRR